MVYIKVLAVVLCSCFIQDALTAERTISQADLYQQTGALQQQTSFPRMLQRSATGPRAPQRLMSAVARQTAAVSPSLKRTMTKKRTAAVMPPPPPPPKYPALAQLKDMAWANAERINSGNAYGKMTIKAVRNAMSGILTSAAFWTALTKLVSKYTKVTNDPERAETRVRICNAMTNALTRPLAVRDYAQMADQAYDALAVLDPTPYLDVVTEALDADEDNRATEFLDKVTEKLNAVELNPDYVTRAFRVIKRTLDNFSKVSMNDGMANSITKIGMMFNRMK